MADGLAKLASLVQTKPAQVLARAFADADLELALVGGSVRDCLMGREVVDLDFTTSARPDQILEIVKPLASVWWDVGRAFGTIAARICGCQVEITTYRSDRYILDSRKPEVVFGQNLEADLLRRDFTINALALRLPKSTLVDPSGGIEDLLAGRLKTPVSAEISFADDPLRMLRAVRFVGQLGFSIEADTLKALERDAHRLEIVSAERIRDEFIKLLLSSNPVPALRILVNSGLARCFLPELPALKLEMDEHHHHKDVYEHSLTVLQQAIGLYSLRDPKGNPDMVLRLAALLHDVGKPATRRLEPGGAVSFYHHDVVGAKLAAKRLKALRFDKATITSVCRLIELHLRFFGYSDHPWSDSAVRRYARDAGEELERLHILTRADVTTRNQRKAKRLRLAYDELETRIAQLGQEEELARIRPELNGEEIMQILNLSPGREVGQAYKFLLNLRLDEGLLGKEVVEKRLLGWWKRQN